MSRKIELPRVVGSTEALRIRTPTTEATTDLLASDAGRLRFEADVKEIARVIGLADRAVPVANYGIGLMLPCERKSVEPIAALAAPKHQWLLIEWPEDEPKPTKSWLSRGTRRATRERRIVKRSKTRAFSA